MAESTQARPLAIAICGESGAGKTTTTGILEDLGFQPCSVSGLLRLEAEAALSSPTRTQVQDYARMKQETEGRDYFARRLISETNPFAQPRTVIDGLRNMAELQTLRQEAERVGATFVLLAMLTPDATRFERVQGRARGGDPVSLEEFQAADQRASGLDEGEQAAQQNNALIKSADARMTNEGSMADLKAGIETLLEELDKA